MRAALVVFALLVSGCATAPPATSGGSAACDSGEGDLFLAAVSGGGFVPQETVPRLVEIARNGTIRVLQGYTQAGNGSVREAQPGSMHELGAQEARDMMARRGFSLEGRDLVVTRGDRALIPGTLYASFCSDVAKTLPKLRDRYEDTQGCADEGSSTWNVSLATGKRTLFVDDCAQDATDFRPLQRQLDTLVGPG